MQVPELQSLEGRVENTNIVTVCDDCNYCFERNTGNAPVELGTVAATSDVSHYLTNSYEYMTTTRLVYEHVIAQQ